MLSIFQSNVCRLFNRQAVRCLGVLLCLGLLSGCIGTVVGAAVDTAIEVVKIPIKVGAAVVDVVTPDKLAEPRDPAEHRRGAYEGANEKAVNDEQVGL